jgi:CheY-like chemotaxis protein
MNRVLVIDDSSTAARAAATILEAGNFEVVVTTDSEHGIDLLRQEHFDLLLTDIYMPEPDGLEVIQTVLRLMPEFPIVAMSGAGEERSMLRVAKHLGARKVLCKPFSPAQLLSAVRTVLAQKPASRSEGGE